MRKTMKNLCFTLILTVLIVTAYAKPVYSLTTEEILEQLEKQRNGYTEEDANRDAGFTAGTTSSGESTSAPAVTPTPKKCTHTYTSEVTTPADCKQEGVRTYTCADCGNTYTEAVPVLTTHTYSEKVTKDVSCSENGEKTFTCTVCGDSYTEVVSSYGHKYEDTVTKEATCTETGVVTTTCTECGDTYDNEIPAFGHSEGEWKITKDNGWFSEGEQEQNCLTCGEVLSTEVIASQYPIWYLYVAIAFAVVLIAAVVALIVVNKKKNRNI